MGRNKNSFSREKSTCHGTLDPVALSFQSWSFFFYLSLLSCQEISSNFFILECWIKKVVPNVKKFLDDWQKFDLEVMCQESNIARNRKSWERSSQCLLHSWTKQMFHGLSYLYFYLFLHEKKNGSWAGSTITKCRFHLYLDLIQTLIKAYTWFKLGILQPSFDLFFLVERSWLCNSILSHNNKKFCLRFVVFFSAKEISAQKILEMSVQCQKCFLRTKCFDKMKIVVVENNTMQVVSSAILIFGLISSLHFNCQVNFYFVNIVPHVSCEFLDNISFA